MFRKGRLTPLVTVLAVIGLAACGDDDPMAVDTAPGQPTISSVAASQFPR